MEEEGAGWRLRMADADWNNPVSLPVTSMTPGLPTIWSPDGARIALTSSIRGLASAVVIPSTGATPEDLVWLAPEAAISIPVAWHPDGDRVVYYATAEGGTLTTFTRSLSTGETKPLIPGETRPVVGGWSPDGSRIAFSVTDGARSTIWVADGDGSNQRALTDEGFESLPFSTGDFGWSPDGREIVYESRRTGTSDLWIVSVDSGAPRQLTRDVRNDHSPAWSPDGGSIAFLSDRGRQTDIWVVSRADGTERRVTD
ncbi:MAG TPA: DPP IV N-terminal domain-containing protein, partial [Gemmatimonadales bacterium]|nr:DPP IV N-terminal domain-containing protein [Gemmatimonadales bacterium]